ncbi:hypothetical protein AK812_SmicGene23047 [Symbiodinium microadriaticum]|uniref:Uncharacterized protein n=1 Tax=Symbiodinium microadriaticum TaxID=2951 RepID=A0A1Q9DI60_SYMMI|nr:hypothetical protein AK812_SmicGene23047 [Symbiodinium microadriaticum]
MGKKIVGLYGQNSFVRFDSEFLTPQLRLSGLVKKIWTEIPPRCSDIKEPTPLQDLASDLVRGLQVLDTKYQANQAWHCLGLAEQGQIRAMEFDGFAFNTAYILGIIVILVYSRPG